jgi:type IV secretion system protein TrbL
MACSIAHPLGCISELAGHAAKEIAGSAFTEIANDFGQAADSAVNWLWAETSAATSVTLGGAGWKTDLGITTALAVSIGLGLFVIQVIASAVRREPGGLARAGRGLLVAFVAGGAAIAVTNLLLGASDAVSAGIVQVGTGKSIEGMGQELLGAAALSSIANPAIVMVVALGMIAATVVVWFALMMRKLLIIVAAVFAPVAFTGALSDLTASWVRKWIEMMIALIVSKIILVTIFVIGLGVLEDGVAGSMRAGTNHAGQTLTQIVVGVLILLMAGFAPFLAIKLVHFAGDSFHAIHASAGSVTQGAQTAIAAPQKMASLGRQASSSFSSAKSSQGPSSAGPRSDNSPGVGSPPAGAQNGTAANTGGGSSVGGAATGATAGGPAAAVGTGQVAKGAVDTADGKVADTATRAPSPSAPRTASTQPTSPAPGAPSKSGPASNGSTKPPPTPPRTG